MGAWRHIEGTSVERDGRAIYVQGKLRVMVSYVQGRWHLCLSHSSRVPTYEELSRARAEFLPEGGWYCEVHPPRELWVNIAPYCRHLWEFADPELQGICEADGVEAAELGLNVEDSSGWPVTPAHKRLFRGWLSLRSTRPLSVYAAAGFMWPTRELDLLLLGTAKRILMVLVQRGWVAETSSRGGGIEYFMTERGRSEFRRVLEGQGV